MTDTTVIKVTSQFSPRGEMGQKYLASGVHVSMRLWDKEPAGEQKAASAREYETVGFVIDGRAEYAAVFTTVSTIEGCTGFATSRAEACGSSWRSSCGATCAGTSTRW